MPTHGVEQSRGVAAESAQQRLTGCTFDGELADTADPVALPIQEVNVEDLGFAVQWPGVPARAAVEPSRHRLEQLHLSVPQWQEQISDTVLGGEQSGKRRECDTGAQVEEHRVDGFDTEMLGQFVADRDIADSLAGRFPRTDP